jgi:ankyrin repeat protein
MLIKYASLFSFLLITMSCSSISDDGAEVTVPFSQVGEALIKEALDAPEISSQLTSSSHAILSSIASKNDYTMPFYDFAVQKYDFNYFGFDSEDPQSWNAFINIPFRDFSRQEADQAQMIINRIVLPSHPFLSQVPFKFHISEFLDQFIINIDFFLDKVAYNIFAQQLSQILALEDPSEAQILLKALLHKAKNSSFPDPEFRYHRAFLANVPFDYFKRTDYCYPEHHHSINSFMSQLAPVLYYEIAADSKQLADETLSGLLPSIYSTLTDTSYENTIGKYQESLLQPIDKSYLWDPQEFHEYLIEALPTLRIAENSNLPPYLKILEFLSDDSPRNHLIYYIAQSYSKPSDLSPQHQLLFWRSLIFSSFTDFSSRFPHYSRQIIEQLQLLPLLDEVQSLFVHGLLDDQFSSQDHFPLISCWGHTFTVDFLLHNRTDIDAAVSGNALIRAAMAGHAFIVELLLQRRTNISAADGGLALVSAAVAGSAPIVDLLLNSRSDIVEAVAGRALQAAAMLGRTLIVEILLQRRTDISDDNCCCALLNVAMAAKQQIAIVDLFLQRRTNIPSDYCAFVLEQAAKAGNTSTVDLLLQRRPDISAVYCGFALLRAAEAGNTSTVDRLLQRRTDISDHHVSSALENATRAGHTSTAHLLQSHMDIAAAHYNRALNNNSYSIVDSDTELDEEDGSNDYDAPKPKKSRH